MFATQLKKLLQPYCEPNLSAEVKLKLHFLATRSKHAF